VFVAADLEQLRPTAFSDDQVLRTLPIRLTTSGSRWSKNSEAPVSIAAMRPISSSVSLFDLVGVLQDGDQESLRVEEQRPIPSTRVLVGHARGPGNLVCTHGNVAF
jgi:hypothetical protein